jgi:hypothetical protein
MFPPLRTRALSLLVVAGLALASPASAGPTIPARGHSKGQVTLQVNPTPQNPVGRQEYVATGVGTMIGRFSQRGVTLFTLEGKVTGTYVQTAADGSTSAGSYSGTFTPISGTPNFRFDVVVIIEGGTGRLAGVTGRLNTTAILNGSTGTFENQSQGVLILP